ncbi:MAG TPA: hypothetical protein VGI06_00895 [Acidimicrobiales bacterium]
MTVFVRELHRVIGAREDEFEEVYRGPDGWMDVLGRGPDARLLYYLAQAHGSGPSYRVVTITAVADGAAWERLARRVNGGDLAALARRTDTLRHDVTAEVMVALPWSPVTDVDLATVPATAADHEPTLFMEDTMWPERGRLGDYLAAAQEHYAPMLERPEALLTLAAALVTAVGARPEVTLLQAVRDPGRIVRLLATDLGPELRPPGSWMHDALEYRDQWRSRLLRSSRWSPWS